MKTIIKELLEGLKYILSITSIGIFLGIGFAAGIKIFHLIP